MECLHPGGRVLRATDARNRGLVWRQIPRPRARTAGGSRISSELRSAVLENATSSFLIHHLDQGIDVAERVGECLIAASIAGDSRDMVGHQHAIVADVPIYADYLDEVD